MPVTESEDGWTESDWTERPAVRLSRLEVAVAKNSEALSKGILDQNHIRQDLKRTSDAVEGILKTLQQEQSEEIAELKRRAELPRRILVAVAGPVLIAVLIALSLALLGHVHVV